VRKLIRLEIKKFKLTSYIKTVFIANFVVLALLCILYFGDNADGNNPFATYTSSFVTFGSLIQAIFTIFASVLIARLFVDEYKSNSISLMFMYPISRKKIMMAKLIIVAVFTFATIFLSNILIGAVFYAADAYLHFVPNPLTAPELAKGFVNMTLKAIASSGMGLIPLYFGMKKKSVPATIVTAIVLVSISSSTINGLDISTFMAVPIILAIVGCLIAFFSIQNIEKADVN